MLDFLGHVKTVLHASFRGGGRWINKHRVPLILIGLNIRWIKSVQYIYHANRVDLFDLNEPAINHFNYLVTEVSCVIRQVIE